VKEDGSAWINRVWRFEFDGPPDPIELKVDRAPYPHRGESTSAAFRFGWRLAVAVGWSKPTT
jgi:hypothetical protein